MLLDDKLAAGEVIALDGGTGTEIARHGGDMDPAAWCALANRDHPDIVRRVHEDYIRAGAEVVTANTFATCRHVLAGAGLADDTARINRRAVELALEARDRAADGRAVAVAGSLSNMVAWRPGTHSVDPRHRPTPEEEAANYREMAEILAEAGVDLLILEMMLDLDHASRLLSAASDTGLPVWVGISCTLGDDGRLTGWDFNSAVLGVPDEAAPGALPLADIVAGLTARGCAAAGIMHSRMAAMDPGLDVLFEHWSGPVMAYPETSQPDREGGRSPPGPSPEAFAAAARSWVERGVQIVGGCCGTTVDHIRAMAEALPSRVGPRSP